MTTVLAVDGEYPWGDGRLRGKLHIKSHFNFRNWKTEFTREFVEVRDGNQGMVLIAMEHYPTPDDAYNAAIEAMFTPAAVGALDKVDFDESSGPHDDAMWTG